MLVPKKARWEEVLGMEFRRFLHAFILLPCQIIRAGRRITCRLLGYNPWLKDFFAAFEKIQCLAVT